MPHNQVQVIIPKSAVDDVIEVAARDGVTLGGVSAAKGPVRTVTFIATHKAQQGLLDDLQKSLHGTEDWTIAIGHIDALVSKSGRKPEEESEEEATESREELLSQVSRDAGLTPTYLTLVAISAVVAALGMMENDVAVIIGAMVIAPLLGPLLGSILGVALGEKGLILRAARASAAGVVLAVAIGVALGVALPFDIRAHELVARASAGFDSIALALAAGAAAALSLTAGAASTLVGVMVAVALLPAATAIGLFLGKMQWLMAGDAFVLLAVNLTALHLSGQTVFLIRGIKPRTRYRRAKVQQAIRFSLTVSGFLLLALGGLIAYQIHAGR